MGLFKSMYKQAKKEAEKAMGVTPPPVSDPANPPTRWEKAVAGLNGIVASVSKIDPDGVDVVCFPGSGGEGGTNYDVFRNIKDCKGLEGLVTAVDPKGDCQMGCALDFVLKEAFERGFEARPCSILVLTAGRPDDHEELSQKLAEAATKVKNSKDLTITFVQVGDDEWAEKYLNHLDTELTTTSADGEVIDIVDTIKDEDVKKAIGEIKENKGGTGALVGALAGAALGVGGMYLMNKMNAKKRTAGWNGKWRATFEGDEIAVLQVKDDMNGNLEITGWPDEGTSKGAYAENEDGGFNIQHSTPDVEEAVIGTVEDEHNISWEDGTKWEEVPPDGGHWTEYAGAAAAGAAAAGATGYLLDKKFFNKASKKVPSDYVIVLDRSAMMAIPDTRK
jgi:hypothetical protein